MKIKPWIETDWYVKRRSEVNELFLNQYNVIKFSLLWKWEICIYAQWNIDEQWLCLLHLSQRKIKAHYLLVTFLQNWLTQYIFSFADLTEFTEYSMSWLKLPTS